MGVTKRNGYTLTERKDGKQMEALFIKGRVDSYSPKWCLDTLTVGGLIEILQEYDEDMLVYL